MNIFLSLYHKLNKRRFEREFKPLVAGKKPWHLVSAPADAGDFLRAAPFLFGLSHAGHVALITRKETERLFPFMKMKHFEIITYEKRPSLFSDEFKRIERYVAEHNFHSLVELNKPANISLPYLADFPRRVAFYDKDCYPYYNVLVKDGYKSLCGFFGIEEEKAENIIHFPSRELRALQKKLGKKQPILFVNEGDTAGWEGDHIVLGEDISPADPDVWKAIYLADAYSGRKDAFFDFAVMNGKKLHGA